MINVIHVHVYDPSNSIFKTKASDRAEIHTYTCDKAEVCDAHKQGRCILVGSIFGRCFGRKSVSRGPTKRAKSFRKFVTDGKSHEKYGALKTQPSKIFKVGNGYMMPYSQVNLDENSPFESKSGFMMTGMPYIENPTEGALSIIYKQRPQAMMGGEIKSYQRDVVPEIVKHMHDEYPELFEKLASIHPEALGVVNEFDYTGKKVKLASLSPGKIKIGSSFWDWDGEYLNGTGGNMIFAPADAIEVRVKPSPDASVKVTNTEMVNENTVMVD